MYGVAPTQCEHIAENETESWSQYSSGGAEKKQKWKKGFKRHNEAETVSCRMGRGGDPTLSGWLGKFFL